LLEELRCLEVDRVTPLAALGLLDQLKKRLGAVRE